MGLLGALFGRRAKAPVDWAEALEAMAQLAQKLQNGLVTFTTGQAGLIIRPPASPPPGCDTAVEVESALRRDGTLLSVAYRVQADDHNHAWVIAEAEKLDALARSLGSASEALQAQGVGERLLAAVFPFTWMDSRLYWVCHPKTGRYTPFLPKGDPQDQLRDYPLEVRMEKALRKDLPTERDVTEWYPLWGIPI